MRQIDYELERKLSISLEQLENDLDKRIDILRETVLTEVKLDILDIFKDKLVVSKENKSEYLNILEEINQSISHESLDLYKQYIDNDYDIESVSVESMDGLKKTLKERFSKLTDNFIRSIAGIETTAREVGGALKSIKTDKLNNLLDEIQDKGLVVNKDVKELKEDTNKSLGVYFAMGHNNVDLKAIQEHLNTPYKLIVENKLLDIMMDKTIHNLSSTAFFEKGMKTEPVSMAELNKITMPNVKSWISKDTKFGILNRYVGSSFSILSATQKFDKKYYHSDCRFDAYKVPDEMWRGKKLSSVSDKDIIDFVKFGIELEGRGERLSDAGKKYTMVVTLKAIVNTMIAGLLNMGTIFITAMSGGLLLPVAVVTIIARLVRMLNMLITFLGGSLKVAMGLKRSHLDAIDLIYDITKEITIAK